MNKVFVSCVSGAQGSAIKNVLFRKGIQIASVTSEYDDSGHVSKGALEDLNALKSAMKNCDAIVYTAPLLFDSTIIKQQCNNLIEAAKSNGIKRIIFNTSIPLGNNKTGYAAIDVKHDALEVLQQSGLELVTLMPTIYLDNLASPFLLPVIQANSIIPYPIAADFKFSWISHENLGRFVFAALNDDSLNGKKILISNGENTTGDELAKIISTAANKTLPYIASAPDDFEDNLKPMLGEYLAKEISNLYRGVDAFRENFQSENNLLHSGNVKLQTISEWAEDIQWTA